MDANTQDWFKSQQARYERESLELENHLRNTRYKDDLLALHIKLNDIDKLLNQQQGRLMAHPSPMGMVKEPPKQIILSPMEKVKLALRKQKLTEEVEGKIRHQVNKELLKRQETDLANVESEDGKKQFTAFFRLEENRQTVARIDAENEAKARLKQNQEEKRENAVHGDIPAISGQFNQQVNKFPQGRVNITHNGQVWEYEGQNNNQFFRIKDSNEEAVVTVRKDAPERGIEEKGNAVLQTRDFKTRELKDDRNAYDLDFALDLGHRHVNQADQHKKKEAVAEPKATDYTRLYPAFNKVSEKPKNEPESSRTDGKDYSRFYPLYDEISPEAKNNDASDAIEPGKGDDGLGMD